MKSVLIISYGPVPTPEYQKIEGGGMRCWGLARGLTANGHDVTVSVNEGFPFKTKKHDDIWLHNWSLNQDFVEYINTFDVVIMSYCMGDESVFIADNISHHTSLILDCYVPIYTEISARDSEDKVTELRNYMSDIKKFNHVLKRGDYFLCANTPQKHMYTGVLGSLGVINPHSYNQDRLLIVPFGIDEMPLPKLNEIDNPYIKLGIDKSNFVLLWFGGLYPWFDFTPLLNSVTELSKNKNFKFVLVGGKNPYNNHPDFLKQYNYVKSKFDHKGLLNKSIFIVDWVDFDERIKWYQGADLVISINQTGEENNYSWRTRVMDYVWGNLPMLTNGGDPLSDELLAKKAALFVGKDEKEIVSVLKNIIKNNSEITYLKDNLARIREKYYWSNVTNILSISIEKEPNPYLNELIFAEKNNVSAIGSNFDNTNIGNINNSSLYKKLSAYAYRAKNKGLRRSAKFGIDIAKSQFKTMAKNSSKSKKKKAIFISHPIDDTGAPLVLLDIADDFSKVYGPKNIHIVAPGIKKHLLNRLHKDGYKIHKMAMGIGGRVIQADLQIKPDDFVLMNTVAVYPNYKQYLFWMLETKRLKKAVWFIHEDMPKLRFSDKGETRRIQKLIELDKLQIIVPSSQTASDYNQFFKTNKVKAVTLRVFVPEKIHQKRSSEDFGTIRFVMSGTPSDGRKGQLLFLAALQLFENKYKIGKTTKYRDYTVDFIAIEDDYISDQIKAISKTLLNNQVKIHPKVPREKALNITNLCNVTVCASLNETFALFVAEGMLMGHVILRNRSSGWQEQMIDGKNGYISGNLNIEDLADNIEKILNKNFSSEKLLEMSKNSQIIAKKFENSNYYKQRYK